jgi:cell fate regulator YaaT (PSP1 superfamily)
MIELNKIVNLMVMVGVVHYSSIAFAADIQVSQGSQIANQTSVSQQTDTGQARTNPVTGPDSSAQSNNDAQKILIPRQTLIAALNNSKLHQQQMETMKMLVLS